MRFVMMRVYAINTLSILDGLFHKSITKTPNIGVVRSACDAGGQDSSLEQADAGREAAGNNQYTIVFLPAGQAYNFIAFACLPGCAGNF